MHYSCMLLSYLWGSFRPQRSAAVPHRAVSTFGGRRASAIRPQQCRGWLKARTPAVGPVRTFGYGGRIKPPLELDVALLEARRAPGGRRQQLRGESVEGCDDRIVAAQTTEQSMRVREAEDALTCEWEQPLARVGVREADREARPCTVAQRLAGRWHLHLDDASTPSTGRLGQRREPLDK